MNFESIEVFEYVISLIFLDACQESNQRPFPFMSLSVSIGHETDILIRYLYMST